MTDAAWKIVHDASLELGAPPPPPEAQGRLVAWLVDRLVRTGRSPLTWAQGALVAVAVVVAATEGDAEACKERLRRIAQVASGADVSGPK